MSRYWGLVVSFVLCWLVMALGILLYGALEMIPKKTVANQQLQPVAPASNYSITFPVVQKDLGYVLIEVRNKKTKKTHLILRHANVLSTGGVSESMVKLEEWSK